jgi:hypothetical protein
MPVLAAVVVVSLGVGIGSPLAGFISGGKIELGLVPIGGIGIVLALLLAGFTAWIGAWRTRERGT